MKSLERHERLDLLASVPLFAGCTPAELDELAQGFSDVHFSKGQTVCREGDPGDTFYVIAKGELEVWGGAASPHVVNRMGAGECLGEAALLLGSKRTATVTAARSSHLLALPEADFQRLLGHNEKVLQRFAQVLAKRLASATRSEAVARRTTLIGVTAKAGVPGRSLVAGALAALLREIAGRETLRLVLEGARTARSDAKLPTLAEVAAEPEDRTRSRLEKGAGGVAELRVALDGGSGELAAGLGDLALKLASGFPLVVCELAQRGPLRQDAAAEAFDVVVEVTDSVRAASPLRRRPHTRVFQVLNLHAPQAQPLSIHHCEPFVLPSDGAIAGLDPGPALECVLANPLGPVSLPLQRLARKILGASVGIALGGGAAFGIAHVGVFQVFEENGIPVDLVAGTSMGSIIALGWAAGITPNQMYEIARRIGNRRTTLSALDPTLTRPGLLAGDRLISIFGPFLGETQRFDQLVRPCRTVATDIESGERVCFTEGRLDAAFRASCSVPMVWSPVMSQGRALVDGAMVDPVPADVVHEMGADVCIAVNVVPPLKRGVSTVLSRFYRRLNAFNPLAWLGGSQDLPNMFDVVMNSIQTLQYELGNFKSISADVRINPDLTDFTWIEFYRPLELIERGALAARRALPEVRRVLAERIAASLPPASA